MKKILLLFVVVFAMSAGSNAQGLDALFGKFANKLSGKTENKKDSVKTGTTTEDELLNLGKSILGGVVDNVVGNKGLTTEDLLSTWNYEGVSCTLESDDMIAEIGAKVVTAKLEEKMNEYLPRLGMEKGHATIRFEENGLCTIIMKEKKIQGTYALSEDGKNITFTFLLGQVTLNSEVEYKGGVFNISFDADKALDVIKRIGSSISQYANNQSTQTAQASQTTAMITAMATLLEGYDGMRLGVRLTK